MKIQLKTSTKIMLTINDRLVETSSDKTLLQAIVEQGIHVPHLCYDTRLVRSNGSCGLCVVQVKTSEDADPQDVKSCQTPVKNGLIVTTSTPEIEAYRKLRLEQLLSDHNADCVAPCVTTCPANIDIQGYLRQAACGNFDAALRIIKERNPLPLSIGRVCPRPCESQCRRNLVDEPVGINNVKRFVADWDIARSKPFVPSRKPATGKKLAIIGGGPSGLTAAWYSAINGHSVTIFESQPFAGGMLRYGIPEYRLPKAVLDKEIGLIQSLGVKIVTGKTLGRDLRLEELKKDFDAIYLAVGSWRASSMRIDGEQANNVWLGINYLEQATKNPLIPLGDNVVVVGGGNTAIDCARVALRNGAKTVSLVYRRSRQEMPAEPYEVDEALHEGIEMLFLAAPQKIECDPTTRNVSGLQCIKMQLGEPDRSGRRRPEPVEGSEFTLPASTVIGAIGQGTDTSYLWNDLPVKLNKWGNVEINKRNMQTSIDGIFSGGDCVTGPATVVQAVGAGRRAAEAIDDYLRLGYPRDSHEDYTCNRGTLEDLPRFEFEILPRAARAPMPSIDARTRRDNFAEVELGLSRENVINEAERCLSCGCNERYNCELRCEATAHGIQHRTPVAALPYRPIVNDHPFIVRDHNKCISCGRCLSACKEIEGPDVLGFYLKDGKQLVGTRSGRLLAETDCISCGQCVTTCPCGALDYRREYDKVFNAMYNTDKLVIGFVAPAVRSAISSYFNIPPDRTADYMAGMMKSLGFDLVFDLSYAADLTILEETTEFIKRVTEGGVLPQFTSCCPGWINLLEKRYPDMIPHISSCKSPQQMMGSLIKAHYPKWSGKKLEHNDIFVVSVVPCIAKKHEAARPEFVTGGVRDVDAVLTTLEVIEMMNISRIDPLSIESSEYDEPYKSFSGAGVLFGASGGVMEAALRMAAEELTGQKLDKVDFEAVRGLEGYKQATLNLAGKDIRVAVINGIDNIEPILERMRNGEDPGYDFIEVMACPGGCIGGAGHPVPEDIRFLDQRKDVLVTIDQDVDLRKSQDNPDLKDLYHEFVGSINSHLAHELFHTHYLPQKGDSDFRDIQRQANSVYRSREIRFVVGGKGTCKNEALGKMLDFQQRIEHAGMNNFIRINPYLFEDTRRTEGIYYLLDGEEISASVAGDLNGLVKELLAPVHR